MLKTASFIIKSKHPLYSYLNDICLNYTFLRNVANFYIRQLQTGLYKEPNKRFPNENEVISLVEKSILKINQNHINSYNLKIKEIKKDKSLSKKDKKKRLENLKKPVEYSIPTKEKSFIGYYALDSILRVSENKDYYNLPGQVNQQAVKDTVESWVSYFNSLKAYKTNPSLFTGRPKIPKYIKNKRTTATFTNQICILKKEEDNNNFYLSFPKTKDVLNLGNYYTGTEKLVEVKVKPVADFFEIYITVETETIDSDGNKLSKKEIITRREEKENKITNSKSKRVIGIDIGLKNIAAISNNIGLSPILIKGSVLVNRNKYYLDKIAQAQTELRQGLDPKDSTKPYTSKKIKRLYAKRDRFLNDYFHKIAHFIINYCINNNIDTIIVGKNPLMKQNLNIGKNTQDFAYVPFSKFFGMLKYLSFENDIKYIENNESYTSKASFLDGDDIPNYGDENEYKFSGKRITRDLYKTSKGYIVNADINGSLNIIRKYDKELTENITVQDISKIRIINFRAFYKNY